MNYKLTPFLIFLLSFFLCETLFSQNNYIEKWYSADSEHLPQNSVKNIVEDKFGFIWIATENGIVRFDGENFKNFNINNLKIKSNRIYNLFGNKKEDSLIACTELDEVILINKRNAFKTDKKTSDIVNYCIQFTNISKNKDSLKQLILKKKPIHSDSGILYYLDYNAITIEDTSGQIVKNYKHLYKTENNYFLFNDYLLCLKNNGQYEIFNSNELTFGDLKFSENEQFYFNPINQQLFLYTNTNIYLIENKNLILNRKLVYSSNNSFDFEIYSLFYDKNSDKTFIGTTSKGLFVSKKNPFNILSNPNHFDNNFYALSALSKNTLITGKNQIFTTKSFVKQLDLATNNQQYTIAVDKEENIWICKSTILIKYLKKTNYKKKVFYDFKREIGKLYCDKQNFIWVSFSQLESKYNIANINAYDKIIKPNFISTIQDEIIFIHEHKNEMLFCTKSKLVFFQPKTKKLRIYKTKENQIRSAYTCKNNNLWICTYNNGFSLFENNVLYKMPIDKKYFLTSAHSILEDIDGYFWITTNKRLIRVKKDNLLKYKHSNENVYYYHYDKTDGLKTNEFNGGCQPNSVVLEDENFIFPSLNGIVSFKPKTLNKITKSNDFFINEVELDENKYFFEEQISIARKTNRVSFYVDFAYLYNSKNISLESKLILEGEREADWLEVPNNRKITFTKLPPGNHSLFIKCYDEELSKFRIKKVTIIVPYFYYEKLWFKFLIGFLLLIIIYIVLKIRYEYIKTKNIELEKIITERTQDLNSTIDFLNDTKLQLHSKIELQKKLMGSISHDIKSPLKYLIIGLKKIEELSNIEENKKINNISTSLKESSEALFNFVNNLVEYSKIVLDDANNLNDFKNVDQIVMEVIDLYSNIANDKNIELTYNNYSKKEILVNNKLTKIIISNLLDNSIKHTSNGKIEASIDLKKDKILFTIKDTGEGISSDTLNYYKNLFKNYNSTKFSFQNHGLGLYLVIDLINLLNGDFSIKSNKPQGTIINIVVDSKINIH